MFKLLSRSYKSVFRPGTGQHLELNEAMSRFLAHEGNKITETDSNLIFEQFYSSEYLPVQTNAMVIVRPQLNAVNESLIQVKAGKMILTQTLLVLFELSIAT